MITILQRCPTIINNILCYPTVLIGIKKVVTNGYYFFILGIFKLNTN